ncbi:MAG: type I-E CRISPR-associated endoribonuclease Cas2, partial [Synergistaceae bacterium]|nr:type I-E CRISPR-associated endoribonuclease Cas2 [Synergistaceae bacterium]
MIVVITIRNCPDKIHGDLTKWLFEIDTGVFVGNLNKRVREGLWERICSNIKSGTVTMAFGANNEQKLDFKIHNSDWESVDYDGIKLVRRNFA